MSDRRSSRPRKQVDYSKFGAINADDDDGDDFVDDLTPPPPQKRSKKETKPKKDPQQKASATGKDGKRRSLDEKLYARDLQLALEKSTATKDLKSPSESLTYLRGPTGPEKVMVEKVEIEGADKRMQTAASATLETTEGCPQREDDQKENQPDSNNDEDYKLEKEDMSSDADDDADDDDDDESDEVSDFEDTLRRPAKKKTSDRSTTKVKTTSLAEGKPAKKTSRPPTKLKPNVPLTSKIGQPPGNSSHTITTWWCKSSVARWQYVKAGFITKSKREAIACDGKSDTVDAIGQDTRTPQKPCNFG
ncbi:hypothetical protein NP493_429g02026 [Ridgeia piscesae]|uniref:Uncharacterized protein n=1 Tax=Ridgeia piscesae TaxID=27915 RepID=A0AAD9KZU8_RIDPI|nr:hypothetical protein NP493_429g02026 [Ridgeia piscesae]